MRFNIIEYLHILSFRLLCKNYSFYENIFYGVHVIFDVKNPFKNKRAYDWF